MLEHLRYRRLQMVGRLRPMERPRSARRWPAPAESPFIRTIAEYSHDVGPRLVFADWLEERGDPWALLIREQCEIATTPAYDLADDSGRASWIHAGPDLYTSIVNLGEMLRENTSDWMVRLATGGGCWPTVARRWEFTPGDLIWWRQSDQQPPNRTRLFWWRGFPERAEMTFGQWESFHTDYMNALPLWHLKLGDRATEGEESIRLMMRYAGRLTTVDIPYSHPVNSFTAWMCRILDTCGEKCHAATGRPFTFKIGQASMSGPPHSAAERWQKYCDGWLKNWNVQIISRLEAQPIRRSREAVLDDPGK